MKFSHFVLALVYGLTGAPLLILGFILGAVVGVFAIGFRAGVKLAGAFWTVKVESARVALLVLLIPTCLLGCLRDKHESWLSARPAVIHEANGFRFGFYGPRDSGWAVDVAPSLEVGLVTVEEVGARLEAQARALAARTGLDAEAAVAELRRLPIFIVDDYSYQLPDGRWACGHYTGAVYTCLWLRTEAGSSAAIPLEAPGWTINPPDGVNVNWRYGARPLVASADHELGHHFFGPNFEH